MIKTRISIVAVALSFAAAALCFGETKKTEPAASPSPAKTAKTTAPKKEAATMANPHLGKWKLNEAKSKLVPGMGKNTMVTYTEQKDNIKVAVVGVDKDGKATHSTWIGKFDGKAYPLKGNLAYNLVAYKTVNDHTNHITAMKDQKIVWTGQITVAADGKSRTVTMTGTGADGKKFKGMAFYDKA